MTPRQLLTRHSFAAFFRSEALSELGVESYRGWLISIAIAFVCFHAQLCRTLARKYAGIAGRNDHTLFLSALAADELFFVSAGFLLVTLLAALQWQALFPSERDYLILSPLPIPKSDIFLSRILALAAFLSIFLFAFNVFPALTFPAIARGPFPLESVGRGIGAQFAAGLGAGLHAFFAVLALQGVCLTLIPHRWRSPVSFLLQSAILVAGIALIPLVWHISGLHSLLQSRAAWISWIPTVWWLGVWETLRGSQDPWFHQMANRALAFSAIAATGAAATYGILYRRFSDFASPPRAASPRRSPLLHLARRRDAGALAWISWTLARSPQHRLILFSIASVGAALALDGFLTSVIRQWTRGRGAASLLLDSALALPLLLNFSLTIALRASFRIPHEWRAHWIFRLTEHAPSRPGQLEGAVAAMYWFALLPAILLALPFQFAVLGAAKTLAALPLIAALNACFIEHTQRDWFRLPFTATYAPSHRPAAVSFVFFFLAFTIYGYGGASLVRALCRGPGPWLIAATLLAAGWLALRRRRRAHWGNEPLDFAGDNEPAVIVTRFAPE